VQVRRTGIVFSRKRERQAPHDISLRTCPKEEGRSGGVAGTFARGARVLSAGSSYPSYFLITGAESARDSQLRIRAARLAPLALRVNPPPSPFARKTAMIIRSRR